MRSRPSICLTTTRKKCNTTESDQNLVKKVLAAQASQPNPVTNKPNRGVKSEKSVNKNRGDGTWYHEKKRKDRHVSGTGEAKVSKGGAGAHNQYRHGKCGRR